MEILYYDESIAVIVKPVGLDSQSQVPQQLCAELGGEAFTVHRLDKNVGGVMVYARTKKAAALLSRAIQNGEMIKEYLAVTHGAPPEKGVLEDFLFKDSRKNKVYIVKKQRVGVKKAKLEYKRLSAGEVSVVWVRLYTGRSHQIRVQFANRGYPLVGDHKYGSQSKRTEPMLYSYRITFPYEGKTVSFKSKPVWADVDA